MFFASISAAIFFSSSVVLLIGARLKERTAEMIGRLKLKRIEGFLARKLILSGRISKEAPCDIMASSFFAFVLFLPVGLLLGLGVVSVVFAAIFAIAPVVSLFNRAKAYQSELEAKLPDMIDLLKFLVESGMSLRAAIERVAVRCDLCALSNELGRISNELAAGSTLENALRAFAKRSDSNDVSSFVALLVNSTRLGSSVALNLAMLSEKMRTLRAQRIERDGHLASQKLLFPIIFFIMPANFVIIFAPLILNLRTIWR